jgi:hypothetical protein
MPRFENTFFNILESWLLRKEKIFLKGIFLGLYLIRTGKEVTSKMWSIFCSKHLYEKERSDDSGDILVSKKIWMK